MNRKQFFEGLKGLVTDIDEMRQIHWAYWLAKSAHRNQERDTGERYFEHCRRVAIAFIEHRKTIYCKDNYCPSDDNYFLDDDSYIIIALLHDCVEDCFLPEILLSRLFDEYIASSIEMLSKIKIKQNPRNGEIKKARKSDKKYYNKIRKSDPGTRIVKCLDRLDNLRTMQEVWARSRQEAYMAETKKYILPIAKE